jgi:trk system potassium uptake protein TrkH
MIRVRVILLIIGYLLSFLGISMLFPLIAELYYVRQDWESFATSSAVTLFVGISLSITCKENKVQNLSIREAFIVTLFSWIMLVIFAALPFYLSNLQLSYHDAFFESMSGLTTTGATIIQDLELASIGILIWRSLLEWVGGIGIIVMAIAVLPFLKVGGMQLFKTESSDKTHKIMPRVRQLSAAIFLIYLAFTVICAILLHYAGMNVFDAVLHAMTTVSTGGFSTYNESIGYFNSWKIEVIIIIFIILASIPFPIHIRLFQGKISNIIKDQQLIGFFTILILSISITIFWLVSKLNIDFVEALRLAAFNVTAIISTAGFASTDYNLWGSSILTFLFLISVIGGCTGSTTGGIKVFRLQVLYKTAKSQIFHLIQPHGIYKVQYNGHSVSPNVASAVMGFFLMFCFCFFILAIFLSLSGLDFITSLSGAAATMANLGPGLGEIIGPAGNYNSLNDLTKWVLSFGMLTGRLEIFTVFVFFSTIFWRD